MYKICMQIVYIVNHTLSSTIVWVIIEKLSFYCDCLK